MDALRLTEDLSRRYRAAGYWGDDLLDLAPWGPLIGLAAPAGPG